LVDGPTRTIRVTQVKENVDAVAADPNAPVLIRAMVDPWADALTATLTPAERTAFTARLLAGATTIFRQMAAEWERENDYPVVSQPPGPIVIPCPPGDETVQHQWNVNGTLTVGNNRDGQWCPGFAGTINLATFDRRLRGAGGSGTFDIKVRVGAAAPVTIFSVVPTIAFADGDNFCLELSGTDLAITSFGATDRFTFAILTKETGAPTDMIAALDVTPS